MWGEMDENEDEDEEVDETEKEERQVAEEEGEDDDCYTTSRVLLE
jgi:hypothetical protein